MRGIPSRLIVALVVTLALGASTASAPLYVFADDPEESGRHDPESRMPNTSFRAWAETRPDGVHVGITVRESTPGSTRRSEPARDEPAQQAVGLQPVADSSMSRSDDAAPRTRTWTDEWGVIHHQAPGGPEITLTPPPLIIGWAPLTTWETWQRDHPEENPFIVRVDDRFSGVIWVPSAAGSELVFESGTGDPSSTVTPVFEVVDPLEVVREILGFLPLPPIEVRMNPPQGLVALSSWYWVEGYDGRPFGGAKTVGEGLGAITIEVRVWPSKYEWSFGDGATQVTQSLGKRYPAESDIRHTYEYSSFRFKEGFPVRLTVTFEAEYRVNNGPWNRLTPIRQTYGTEYPVQEVQTVLRQP